MPQDSMCVVCMNERATIRCKDCGPHQYMCLTCSKHLHSSRNQFHLLGLRKDEMFFPLYPDHGVIGYGHDCLTKIRKSFTLVDSHGIKHVKQVEVCDCEPHAVTLIRCDFWPGSPQKPTVGFHFKLMNMMEKLFLQSQVSVHDFSEVLHALQPHLGHRILTSMYSVLNSGCFEEFRLFKYKFHYLSSYCSHLTNGTDCPLCPQDDGVLIESMDACMGLVRKKVKGSTGLFLEPRHGTLIFSDQEDADNFVDNYGKDRVKQEQNCSRFHAGEVLTSLRSKGRNKLFDEKGVFGRVCRHDFPKGFINLKHGERISYSLYEIQKLKESVEDKPDVKVILMYDIACTLSSHLKATNQEHLTLGMEMAIPIFHCYGHKASCQIEYSPRRIEGIGLTDGEGVERLWAYLRGFSSMTKEMGAGKRTDVLTDALLFYGQKLYQKFGLSLKSKLLKAQEQLSAIKKEMKQIMDAFPNSITVDEIQKWKTSEFENIKPKQNVLEFTWDETYVNLLLEVEYLRGDLAFGVEGDQERAGTAEKKMKRKKKDLEALEKKHGIRKRWKNTDPAFQNAKQRLISKQRGALHLKLHGLASERIFLIEMKKKYADGQGIAIKLTNQISKVSDAMRKCLSSLNALGDGEEITFEEIKSPESIFYEEIENSVSSVHPCRPNVPQCTKKQLVSLLCLHNRCLEEIELVKVEIIRFLSFHFKQLMIIDDFLATLGGTTHERGLKALFLAKRLVIEIDQACFQRSVESLSVSPYNTIEVTSFSCLSGVTVINVEDEKLDDDISDSTVDGDPDEVYWYGSDDESDDDV